MIEIDGRQWLQMDEVLDTLHISKSTFTAVRRRHGGPDGQLRLGRRLYWNRASLAAWLHDCEGSSDITPAPRAEPPAHAEPVRQQASATEQPYALARQPIDLYAGVGEVVDYGAR